MIGRGALATGDMPAAMASLLGGEAVQGSQTPPNKRMHCARDSRYRLYPLRVIRRVPQTGLGVAHTIPEPDDGLRYGHNEFTQAT
jgi:hypothetical protein